MSVHESRGLLHYKWDQGLLFYGNPISLQWKGISHGGLSRKATKVSEPSIHVPPKVTKSNDSSGVAGSLIINIENISNQKFASLGISIHGILGWFNYCYLFLHFFRVLPLSKYVQSQRILQRSNSIGVNYFISGTYKYVFSWGTTLLYFYFNMHGSLCFVMYSVFLTQESFRFFFFKKYTGLFVFTKFNA